MYLSFHVMVFEIEVYFAFVASGGGGGAYLFILLNG